MGADWTWWLTLVVAVLLFAAPVLGVISRSGARRVPVSGWAGRVRAPWWTHVLSCAAIPLLFLAARGLGDGGEGRWSYLVGGAVASLLLQLGLVQAHNRRATSP